MTKLAILKRTMNLWTVFLLLYSKNHSSSASACCDTHWNRSYCIHMALLTTSARMNMKSVSDRAYLSLTLRSAQLTFSCFPLRRFVMVRIEGGAVRSSMSEWNVLFAFSGRAASLSQILQPQVCEEIYAHSEWHLTCDHWCKLPFLFSVLKPSSWSHFHVVSTPICIGNPDLWMLLDRWVIYLTTE